ncbi:MAG: hypothetical protein ACYCVH_04185 [Ignavibacteriaceae bacterium]
MKKERTIMELLQIIIFSLKLFTLVSIIVVAISYAIYKVKNSSRVKPYMRPTVVSENKIQIEVDEKISEEIKQANKRFVIMNEAQMQQRENGAVYYVPAANPQQRPNRQLPAEGFNIYNYYSNSNFEPMHKVKL